MGRGQGAGQGGRAEDGGVVPGERRDGAQSAQRRHEFGGEGVAEGVLVEGADVPYTAGDDDAVRGEQVGEAPRARPAALAPWVIAEVACGSPWAARAATVCRDGAGSPLVRR